MNKDPNDLSQPWLDHITWPPTPATSSASELAAPDSSTITDNVGRTPKQLVEEISKELRSIEEKFQRSDGIEAAVARQEAVLNLILWGVGRLARMMSNVQVMPAENGASTH